MRESHEHRNNFYSISSSVSPGQRYTASDPCPICGGWDNHKRGIGARCWGFVSEDGRFARCTRDEYKGKIPEPEPTTGAYCHVLAGECLCGKVHGAVAPDLSSVNRFRSRAVRSYFDYCDEDGHLLYQVVRVDNSSSAGRTKNFWVRRPKVSAPSNTDDDDWDKGFGGVRRVPYRLQELVSHLPTVESPVFVVEGEKHVDRLAQLGLCATTNVLGAEKWRGEYDRFFRGQHVVVLPDNDDPGRRHGAQIEAHLLSVAASVKVLELPGLPAKGDVLDWLNTGGTKDGLLAMATLGVTAQEPIAPAERLVPDEPAQSDARQRKTAATLMTKTFELRQDVVPGLFVEGTTMCGGKPKAGKSNLGIQIALSVAAKKPVLGSLASKPGRVLYLDFEMGEQMLQERLLELTGGSDAPESFEYETFEDADRCPKLNDGLNDYLEDWLRETPDARLIIIDTFKAVRPKGKGGNTSVYDQDYEALAPLTQLSHVYHVAIVLFHHLTKPPSATDPFDELNGSSGLQGAVDTLMVMRGARGTGEVDLHVTGRRIRDREPLALKRDPVSGVWTCVGTVSDARMSDSRRAIQAVLKASEVFMHSNEVARCVRANPNTTKNLLYSMVNDGQAITEPGTGRFGVPGKVHAERGEQSPRPLPFPVNRAPASDTGAFPVVETL